MSPLILGFSGMGVVLILLLLRMPVGAALAIVSLSGIAMLRSPEAALAALGAMPHDFAAHWSLSAIPMFLLMGALAHHSGLTSDLFRAARVWLNFLPGGVAIATNFACAGFAAMSGSSLATASAMGRLAVPDMLKLRYDPGLSTAVVAAGGTLGSLIPPSVLMIIYGWAAEQPINELLMAGILPGILTAVIYSAMIIARCSANPSLAPRSQERFTWAERIDVVSRTWPVPLLFLAIVGGLYGGVVTATESGAFGALAVIVITLFQGKLGWRALWASIVEALETTASIFFVAIGAVLFSRFLAYCGVPAFLGGLITSNGVDPLVVVLGISVLYLVLGMFLDPIGLLLVTLPVVLPMFKAANLDLVWMGVIVIKYLEIGLLTPPVGMNAFVIKSVVGDLVPLSTIFRGLLWFLAAEVVVMVLLISFPSISLFIPQLMR